MTSLVDRSRALLQRAIQVYWGSPHHVRLVAARDRLEEPLRVAVAGRVKAGKSTLLNALVGERLAPTDTRECTRIVTWYQDGHTYRVVAHTKEGEARPLRFRREERALEVDLGDLRPGDVEQMMVTWPSQALRVATLIDTPGIGSLSEQVSRRTWQLLVPEEEETPADAVIYLMRHAHAGDVEFLRAFHDTEVSQPNPVNAIGVLSRADEIAVGRLDAMASAERIASQLATDPNVRRVVQTVVPVAGLLAETAVTLTETDVKHLRRVADIPAQQADDLLLSADRFMNKMPELARHLADHSGLRHLKNVLGSLFFERRDILKSRSALLAIDALTRVAPRPGSDTLATETERVLASAHPFNELRVLYAIRAGWVSGKAEVMADLEHLIGGAGGAMHVRLRLDPKAGRAELTSAATEALARWQRRAENPLTGHQLAVAARVAVRSCEGMLAELRRAR